MYKPKRLVAADIDAVGAGDVHGAVPGLAGHPLVLLLYRITMYLTGKPVGHNLGYFASSKGYFETLWPVTLGHFAFQVS